MAVLGTRVKPEMLVAKVGDRVAFSILRVEPMDSRTLQKMADGRRKRGKITGRSVSSVKRLALGMAEHALLFAKPFSWVTLTYGRESPNWTVANQDFDLFRRRLKYHYSECAGFWVSEVQNKTRHAPHFHLALDCVEDGFKGSICDMWLPIAGDNGNLRRHRKRYGVHVVKTLGDSGKGIMLYMTKVQLDMLKSKQQESDENRGRTWGKINRAALQKYYRPLELVELSEKELEEEISIRLTEQEFEKGCHVREVQDGNTEDTIKLLFPRMWNMR